jgi:O-antigen ligase
VLIPPLLVVSIFLADLSVCIIALAMIYLIFQKKLFFLINNKYFICFGLFCLYSIFRSLFSLDYLFSLKSTLFYFRFGFLCIGIYYTLICFKQNFLKLFYLILFTTFSIVIIDGYIQSFTGFNSIGYPIPQKYRISGFFHTEMILGSYLAKLLPLVMAGLFFFKKNLKMFKYNFFLFVIFTLVMIVLSGERSATFQAIALVILFLFFTDIYGLKEKLLLAFSIVAIIFLLISTNERLESRYLDQTYKSIKTETGLKIFTHDTQSHYFSAIKMFKDNPLFGQGVKMFRKLCSKPEYNYDKNSCTTHPHNTYLEILAELGLVGFAFLFLLLCFICKFFITVFLNKLTKVNYKIDNTKLILMSCFFINLWPLMPTGRFFNNWLSIVYYLPVGFYFFYLNSKKNE